MRTYWPQRAIHVSLRFHSRKWSVGKGLIGFSHSEWLITQQQCTSALQMGMTGEGNQCSPWQESRPPRLGWQLGLLKVRITGKRANWKTMTDCKKHGGGIKKMTQFPNLCFRANRGLFSETKNVLDLGRRNVGFGTLLKRYESCPGEQVTCLTDPMREELAHGGQASFPVLWAKCVAWHTHFWMTGQAWERKDKSFEWVCLWVEFWYKWKCF